jgi:3-hydroxy acid dehydrogenase / malonic semialdehyde reductase
MKTALITGATSGIGQATAVLFAKEKYRLILCGRRIDRLLSLEEELKEFTEVQILSFDVKNNEEVTNSINSLNDSWKNIDILINSAGNAHGLSPIYSGNIDDWDAMMDINVKGLLYVSRAILPGMVERMHGHIVNLGSIAGKEVYPNGNVYCASKYAVDAISKSMRIDLNAFNIKVTSINPGMVNTEFSEVRFKGDMEKAKTVYKDMRPLLAEDIAETILFIINRPSHVNKADLTILPTDQASATIVNRNH